MELHNCHNRVFPKTVIVQDGWVEMDVQGAITPNDHCRTRVPHMIEIPFTMSTICHQWNEPFGAIRKGLIDSAGCKDCMHLPIPNTQVTHPYE